MTTDGLANDFVGEIVRDSRAVTYIANLRVNGETLNKLSELGEAAARTTARAVRLQTVFGLAAWTAN